MVPLRFGCAPCVRAPWKVLSGALVPAVSVSYPPSVCVCDLQMSPCHRLYATTPTPTLKTGMPQVPEVVPFRLTPNMRDALGLTGVEGVYRKSCETTMSVLRDSKDTLMVPTPHPKLSLFYPSAFADCTDLIRPPQNPSPTLCTPRPRPIYPCTYDSSDSHPSVAVCVCGRASGRVLPRASWKPFCTIR